MGEHEVLAVVSSRWRLPKDIAASMDSPPGKTRMAVLLGRLVEWGFLERQARPLRQGGRLFFYRRRTL